jgi:uncharacterized membrane protein YqjE
MKNSLKYIGYLSFVLNFVFIVTWIRVFSRHDDHNARVKEFDSLLPGELTAYFVSIGLILLTVLSIIVFAKSHYTGNKILLVGQVLFLALLVWGYL